MHATVDDLKQYLARKNELRNLIASSSERVARMRSSEQYPSLKTSDGSQHTASASDLTAQAIERRLALYADTETQIANLTAQIRAVETAVQSIADSQQRQVLRYRYMDADYCRNPQWWVIAKKMYGGTDERHIRACLRVHRAALVSFTKTGVFVI